MKEQQDAAIEDQMPGIIGSLIAHLGTLARTDLRLAGLLEELGREFLRIAAGSRSASTEVEGVLPEPTPIATSEPTISEETAGTVDELRGQQADRSRRERSRVDLPPITFSTAPVESTAIERHGYRPVIAATADDLALIETRCRIKAEGCRWQQKRRRLLEAGAEFKTEIQPLDAEIIGRARAVQDCYLWMCNPNAPMLENPSLYDEVADCFDICGDAVSFLRTVSEGTATSEGYLERAMDLAAEAQSMLRVMLSPFGDLKDSDQNRLFQWLRLKCNQEQILIQRYMRLDDAADPNQLNALRERLRTLDAEYTQRREREKSRRGYFSKVRYHLKQIAERAWQNHDRDWQTITSTVEALVNEGALPSNVELRDLLLPFVDVMPVEAAECPAMQRVLVEIDRFLASRPTIVDDGPREQPTEAVESVAKLLAGRSILMVGGEMRVHAKRALEEAFHLRELVWMKTREHNTRIDFDPAVSQPDIIVVLLAIRWSRHCFADVKDSCERYGRHLVYLPAGYNPNQVAEQVLSQCGDRLRSA